MKSGTTTLNDYLSLNEDILMCPSKEPQFFSSKYDEGIANYESLWSDTSKVCGEASTCYSRWPFYQDVPKRIASYNTSMKLIFIMRDPVERAYSHFRHNVLTDQFKYKSFSDALLKSDEIRLTSMYMTQIEKFLEFFPKDQMLLIDFDVLTKNPIMTINEIEIFLNVHIDIVAKDSELLSLTDNDLAFSFSESKTALLLTVNREYTSMHADIYTNDKFFASVKIGKKGQIKIPKRSDIGRNLLNSTSSQNDIQLFLKD